MWGSRSGLINCFTATSEITVERCLYAYQTCNIIFKVWEKEKGTLSEPLALEILAFAVAQQNFIPYCNLLWKCPELQKWPTVLFYKRQIE